MIFPQKILQFFGALKLAILLILLLAGVCTVATFFESAYGTAAVQYSIYKTWWFGALLGLIGLNVTCAAFKKYPWKYYQVGFLVTHLGLLVIIIGSFISFQWGIDAQLPLMIEETKDYYYLTEEKIELEILDQNKVFSKTLEIGPYVRADEIAQFHPSEDVTIKVDHFYPFARPETKILPDEKASGKAILLGLKNNFVNVEEWLFLDESHPATLALGPAEIQFLTLNSWKEKRQFLKKTASKENAFGTLKLRVDQKTYVVELFQKNLGKTLSIPNTDFKFEGIEYYSDAIVSNNKLVNRSDQNINPAVKLNLVGPKGTQKHVAFSNFPNFPSTHEDNNLYGAKVEFVASQNASSAKGKLQIGLYKPSFSAGSSVIPAKAGNLYYRVQSSKEIQTGKVKVGTEIETGWMNLRFQVLKFYPKAIQKIDYVPVQVKDPNNAKFGSAIRFRFLKIPAVTPAKAGVSAEVTDEMTSWLGFGDQKIENFLDQRYRLSFAPKRQPFGFSLALEKFEIGKDPGTQNPASYQSTVILKDPDLAGPQKHLISMNEPLTYKGYTFYQSSYFNDDMGNPIGSVLSVGYDPGRTLKYGGSILLCLGIALMFFFRKTYMNAYQAWKKQRAVIPTKVGI